MDPVNRVAAHLGTTPPPCRNWARPRDAALSPAEKERLGGEEAGGEPPFGPEDGSLPSGSCRVCGGTHGHVGVCPEGLNEVVYFRTRPARIAVIRKYAPGYCPAEEFRTTAELCDRADPGGPFGAYYRRAAVLAESVMAFEGPTTTPAPEPEGGAGQTAVQWLLQPHAHAAPAPPPKKPPAPGPSFFPDEGPSNYDAGV